MGALDRFKSKAEELREKAKPMAESLKEKAERTTESLKGKMNEYGDARTPKPDSPDPTPNEHHASPEDDGNNPVHPSA